MENCLLTAGHVLLHGMYVDMLYDGVLYSLTKYDLRGYVNPAISETEVECTSCHLDYACFVLPRGITGGLVVSEAELEKEELLDNCAYLPDGKGGYTYVECQTLVTKPTNATFRGDECTCAETCFEGYTTERLGHGSSGSPVMKEGKVVGIMIMGQDSYIPAQWFKDNGYKGELDDRTAEMQLRRSIYVKMSAVMDDFEERMKHNAWRNSLARPC